MAYSYIFQTQGLVFQVYLEWAFWRQMPPRFFKGKVPMKKIRRLWTAASLPPPRRQDAIRSSSPWMGPIQTPLPRGTGTMPMTIHTSYWDLKIFSGQNSFLLFQNVIIWYFNPSKWGTVIWKLNHSLLLGLHTNDFKRQEHFQCTFTYIVFDLVHNLDLMTTKNLNLKHELLN